MRYLRPKTDTNLAVTSHRTIRMVQRTYLWRVYNLTLPMVQRNMKTVKLSKRYTPENMPPVLKNRTSTRF